MNDKFLIRKPMGKFPQQLPIVLLLATTLAIPSTADFHPAQAQTCLAATSCRNQSVKFVPGQRITVEVANLTNSIIQLQQVDVTDPLSVSPGQVLSFVRGGNTNPNFSAVFWDAQGLPLNVNIRKPEARVLRIEILPSGRAPGARAVYLQDDGRVEVM
ncbi:MAG: hypothetical protein RID09_05400 [Coleofasciculus sp. G1-WW12-02]|uniref:hypothetical protein n=1 Tax=Coleofasciculus sp. G1-WW12-02 TaxID=3068483 RepID=UPI0032F9CD19